MVRPSFCYLKCSSVRASLSTVFKSLIIIKLVNDRDLIEIICGEDRIYIIDAIEDELRLGFLTLIPEVNKSLEICIVPDVSEEVKRCLPYLLQVEVYIIQVVLRELLCSTLRSEV